jgi:hypothetical protein
MVIICAMSAFLIMRSTTADVPKSQILCGARSVLTVGSVVPTGIWFEMLRDEPLKTSFQL